MKIDSKSSALLAAARMAITVILCAYITSSSAQPGDEGRSNDVQEFSGAVNTSRSANSKDALSNIFRASLDDLFGEKKTLQLNATVFALDSLLNPHHRGNGEAEYRKQRRQRNSQLNISLSSGENREITNIKAGFTVALINRKDITYGDFGTKLIPLMNRFSDLRRSINQQLMERYENDFRRVSKDGPDLSRLVDSAMDVIYTSWNEASSQRDYSSLHEDIVEQMNELASDDRDFILANGKHTAFKNAVAGYARRGLLTLSGDFDYNRLADQPEYRLSLYYTKGLTTNISNERPWELEARAEMFLGKDTLIAARNTDHLYFNAQAGFNKILLQDGNGHSSMEIKGFAAYNYTRPNLNDRPYSEQFTFNSTLRIRIIESLWLPVTMSYDPKNANFLGYFSIVANVGDLFNQK